eukprot:evm.model.scf_333.6 EVM.evm.TU.scf_333.6   scf_333:84348-99607(+)
MDSNRSRKRPRTGAFKKGSLKRIKLENFMTYKKAEVVAKPSLNVILGPNGTGKSSLVCALCLGLAGRPKLLGRADNLRDYVLRGKKGGSVEVTISGGGEERDKTIRRELNSKDNTSTWTIDEKPATMAEVEKLKDRMNIQLDNLCQFLPQDRVVEFARLSPTDLLLETEKAIGNSRLCEQHKELMELGKASRLQRQNMAAIEKELAKAKQSQEHNGQDVENYELRQSLFETIEAAKAKKQWAEVHEREMRLEESREKLEAAKRAVATAADKEKKALKSIAPLKADKVLYMKENDSTRKQCESGACAIKRLGNHASEQVAELKGHAEGLENGEEDSQKVCEKIKSKEDALAKATEQLKSLGQVSPQYKTNMDRLRVLVSDSNTKARCYQRDMGLVEQELSQAIRHCNAIQDKLKRLNDIKFQRIRYLEHRRPAFRGLLQAYEWVQKNQHLFRSHVYGPLCAEVVVADKQIAACLEGTVPLHVWTYFVTQTREDSDKLRSCLRDHMRNGGSVLCYNDDSTAPLHPPNQATAIPEFGIAHTLDEVFEAPNAVKQVLNSDAAISRCYIGTRETQECLEELLQCRHDVSRVCTPDEIVSVKVSRYGGGVRSTIHRATPQPAFLTLSSGGDEVDRLRNDLLKAQQVMRDLQEQQAEHEKDYRQAKQSLDAAKKEKNELTNKEQKRSEQCKKLKIQIKTHERVLRKLRKRNSPKGEGSECEQALEAGMGDYLREVRHGMAKIMHWWPVYEEHAAAALRLAECSMKLTESTNSATSMKIDKKRHQRIHNQIVHIVRSDERKLRESEKDAEHDFPLSQELEAKFRELPDDDEDLEDFIEETQMQANGIVCANPAAAQRYRANLQTISRLEKELREQSVQLQDLEAMIATRKDEWLPDLRKVVEKINKTFSRNFAKIGCAGEVRLAGEDQYTDQYDKYAVEILVKFREEEDLEPLDATRQSGGERSVATMLYLISLQACATHVVIGAFRHLNVVANKWLKLLALWWLAGPKPQDRAA